MNNLTKSVLSWLKSVPTDHSFTEPRPTLTDQPHSKKRPYFRSDRPLSPPPSQFNTGSAGWMPPSTPSNKKRRLGGVLVLAAPPDNGIEEEDPNNETP
ncbi:hypothetical protein FZEAL_6256 [Fusarium zealandicum]|uniref:Uncharacterized protein n=1 Tax=Fusarium zealandicum TaxID=1053134 RepID=A0A8H4UIA1_9HYPO|nr:hypothetical protein FZEAL_6256 [Fusarium zealandicum]